MKTALIALVLLGGAAFFASAQSATTPATASPSIGIPDVVVDGFRAYLNGGYAGATSVWSRNSTLQLDTQAVQNMNTILLTEGNLAGAFTGAEVVRIVSLSQSVEEVYVSAKYQNGILFMSFTCYKQPDKWIVTAFAADKDATKIIPTNVMGGL